MDRPRLLLVILLLSLICVTPRAFVIGKRSQSADSHLAEALRAIERERRRLQEEEITYRTDPRESYLWDEDGDEGNEARVDAAEDRDDNSYLRGLFSAPRYPISREDLENYLGSENDAPQTEVMEPGVEEGPKSKRISTVDKDELQEIFNPGNQAKREVDRLEKAKREGGKREYDPSNAAAKDKKQGADMENVVLSADVVNKLIDSVEENEKAALADREDENNEEMTNTFEPVSNTEMDSLFDDAPSSDIGHADLDKVENADDMNNPSELNKEHMADQYPVADSESNLKRKRSNGALRENDDDEQDEEAGDTEPLITNEQLDLLRQYLEFEDAENSNLAKALNLATRGQVERTDKFIPEETAYLKAAIRDEEGIQAVKSFVQGAVQEEGPMGDEDVELEEDIEESEPGLLRKRGYPEEEFYVPNANELGLEVDDQDLVDDDITIPEEVNEVPEELNDLDDADIPSAQEEEEEYILDNKDAMDDELKMKLKQFLLRTVINDIVEKQEEEEEEEDEEEGEEELLQELEDEEAVRPDVSQLVRWYHSPESQGALSKQDWYMNPFLRDIIRKYQEGRMRKRGYVEEVDEPGTFGAFVNKRGSGSASAADACPAVQLLTNNCQFARRMGLGLDPEALSLCNRHQLCYACGSEHGLSEDDCDRGYLADTDLTCGDDADCKDDAAGLYVLMLDNHSYRERYQTKYICKADCAYTYIA